MPETQSRLLRRVDEQARKVLRTGEDADVAFLLRVYDDALAAVIRDVEATWTALLSMQPDDPRARFLEWKRTRETALRDQMAHRMEQLRHNAVETLRSGLLSMYEDQFVLDAYALDEATPPSVVVNLRGLTPSQAEGIVATPWKGAMFSDRIWVLSDDMLREMQNALGQSALLGEGIDKAVSRLRDLKALDGNVPPRYALERLARTELLKAADRARERLYQDNESVVDGEQVLVTLDDRTCETCGPLDGKDLDSDEVQDHLSAEDADKRPPFHPNAVLEGSTFSSYGEAKELVAARYNGPAVRIWCGGQHTTIGPNHPMATARGMVRADAIHEGDQLVYDRREDSSLLIRAGAGRETNLEKVELREDVFQAARSIRVHANVAASGRDFHGDSIFCEGEVYVVRPERSLLPVRDASLVEKLGENVLVRSNARERRLVGAGTQTEYRKGILLAASRGMGGGGSWGAHFDLRRVDRIELVHFVGWAFDATTASSLYCNNGFVVSNCRCTTIPKLKSWRDLLGTDELPDDLRGFDPTERVVRGPDGRSEIAPRQSFEQWMNSRVIARVGTHEARQEQHRQLQESNRAAGCCLHGSHAA